MSGVFHIADGWQGYYASLPGASDSIIAVVLRAAEAEADLLAHETLSEVLAVNTEANFSGYSRKTMTGVSWVVDHTAGTPIFTFDAFAWDPAGGAVNNSTAKLLVCYKPASGSADSAVVPMFAIDYVYQTDPSGLYAIGFQPSTQGVWRTRAAAA